MGSVYGSIFWFTFTIEFTSWLYGSSLWIEFRIEFRVEFIELVCGTNFRTEYRGWVYMSWLCVVFYGVDSLGRFNGSCFGLSLLSIFWFDCNSYAYELCLRVSLGATLLDRITSHDSKLIVRVVFTCKC